MTKAETEKKPAVKRNKKVAICGTAPSLSQAPFDDKETDIWGVAHCAYIKTALRMDEIFEVHLREIWEQDKWPGQEGKILLDLVGHRFPNAKIWLHEAYKDVKNSARYPVEEMRKKYGNYWTSSIPFMICMAIDRGYEEISLYGIHLLQDEEFFYQRPCVEYFLGIAHGLGIKIFIPDAADILKFSHMYGWQDVTVDKKKGYERLREFDERMKQMHAVREQKLNAIQQLFGVLSEKKRSVGLFSQNEANKDYVTQLNTDIAGINAEGEKNRADVSKLEAEINQIIGAAEDTKYWLKMMGEIKT